MSNCLFLATTDEALVRAAALLELWGSGFVEPVNAPPKPFHILSQQLMALVFKSVGLADVHSRTGSPTFRRFRSSQPSK